jgi:hypothetical protein
MESAKQRDIRNLQNWVKNTGCIARDETMYLDQGFDLMALETRTIDGALHRLQGPLEDLAAWLSRKVPRNIRDWEKCVSA